MVKILVIAFVAAMCYVTFSLDQSVKGLLGVCGSETCPPGISTTFFVNTWLFVCHLAIGFLLWGADFNTVTRPMSEGATQQPRLTVRRCAVVHWLLARAQQGALVACRAQA